MLLWLCWVFVACTGFLWLWRVGLSLCHGALLLTVALRCRSTGSRAGALSSGGSQVQSTGSIVVAMACGIFLVQGWNPCFLHWQADSLPLNYQESPKIFIFLMNLWFSMLELSFLYNVGLIQIAVTEKSSLSLVARC